ncbi:RNA polymerase sigma-70 factor [Streptomyces actinomycinicus]|uniref:RNA polymerase sigma-70 factor n=1 Tax=Streptomyces actinomycinicus TaxID=1695166 RepID=A0A937EPA6_9ACTN|nr:RNA polymerase sigma-70 factor [Streptomyces actinomycinicus]MBL1087018.1 RNA polymerase sigma-70 factor [Streptomyces actinomycinicus]
MTTVPPAEAFEAHRARLFGLAYRLLGSAQEAEDAVQDAYLRFSGADRAAIEHLGAWLAKTVTNLCLNRLTSARARREQYVGTWLPEPVVTADGTLGPLESAERRDQVSLALLVLLERLTPAERAVYVLREAFGYAHREIADVLELSEANCRQLYRRAALRVAEPEGRFEAAPERQADLVASFVTAAREGDLAALERLLAADVIWWADGGGRVTAALRPIEGRDKVVRFLAGISRRFAPDTEFTAAEVNGEAALVTWAGGTLVAIAVPELRGGLITRVRAVVNPDKLRFARQQLARV